MERQRSAAGAGATASRLPLHTEHRMAALVVAGVLVASALLGSMNLLLDDVVRPGAARAVYGVAMAALTVAAVLLVARRRIRRPTVLALVLFGDLVYVAIALTLVDPMRYATPLMLLFPAFVAAWFLDGWMFLLSLVVTPVAVTVGLWSTYDTVPGLVIQICLSAGMLVGASFGVFVLRRRVQRLLAATQALSRQDPLTGLSNRRHLEEQAVRLWRQARREGMRVAAMVLDLDHFKQLNDAHGHAAGDEMLRAVASALASTVRPADVLARIGGEELVVLGMVGDSAEAHRVAERLRAAVARTRTARGYAVTTSIGIALVRPSDGEAATTGLWRLIDNADAAMYEAKQAGRDQVVASLASRPPPAQGAEALAPDPADDVA